MHLGQVVDALGQQVGIVDFEETWQETTILFHGR